VQKRKLNFHLEDVALAAWFASKKKRENTQLFYDASLKISNGIPCIPGTCLERDSFRDDRDLQFSQLQPLRFEGILEAHCHIEVVPHSRKKNFCVTTREKPLIMGRTVRGLQSPLKETSVSSSPKLPPCRYQQRLRHQGPSNPVHQHLLPHSYLDHHIYQNSYRGE